MKFKIIEKEEEKMEELLEILNEIDDSIDYENETALIDDQLLDSFAIITLVSELEDAFDIMMEMKDILDFNSYEHGKVVLKEVYGVDVEK